MIKPEYRDGIQSEDDLDVDLWKAATFLWRWRWVLAGAAVAGAALAFLATILLPKTYEATAIVSVSTPPSLSSLGHPAVTTKAIAGIAMSGFAQTLLREELVRTNAIRVGDSIGTLAAAEDPQLSVVMLTVDAPDPATAPKTANTWASLLTSDERLLAPVTRSPNAAFILAEYPKATAQVTEARRRLTQLQNKQAAALTAVQTRSAIDLKQSMLNSVTDQLVAARREQAQLAGELADASHALEAATAELQRTPPHLTTSRTVPVDAIRTSGSTGGRAAEGVVRVESEEINPVYTDLARKVADARIRTATLGSRTQTLTATVNALEARATALRHQINAAAITIDALKRQQAIDISPAEATVTEAESKADALRAQVGLAQLAQSQGTVVLKVASNAGAPGVAQVRHRLIYLILGAFAGLLVGSVAAWVRSHALASTD